MRRVCVESPFAGDLQRNLAYARAAMRDCLRRGSRPTMPNHLKRQREESLRNKGARNDA